MVAYIQAFGHHDDIGGRVPGSMPGTAATVFEEGLAIPPIKLYSAGVRNEAVFTIIKRNTRVPEMLAADLDSEVQACLMGARRMAELFERFGCETVEACFQAILDKCRDIFRHELLPKIADGTYRWEDYVEIAQEISGNYIAGVTGRGSGWERLGADGQQPASWRAACVRDRAGGWARGFAGYFRRGRETGACAVNRGGTHNGRPELAPNDGFPLRAPHGTAQGRAGSHARTRHPLGSASSRIEVDGAAGSLYSRPS